MALSVSLKKRAGKEMEKCVRVINFLCRYQKTEDRLRAASHMRWNGRMVYGSF